MTNFEIYKEEIRRAANDEGIFRIDKNKRGKTAIEECKAVLIEDCRSCMFHNEKECTSNMILWGVEEFNFTDLLTPKDIDFLKMVKTGAIERLSNTDWFHYLPCGIGGHERVPIPSEWNLFTYLDEEFDRGRYTIFDVESILNDLGENTVGLDEGECDYKDFLTTEDIKFLKLVKTGVIEKSSTSDQKYYVHYGMREKIPVPNEWNLFSCMDIDECQRHVIDVEAALKGLTSEEGKEENE